MTRVSITLLVGVLIASVIAQTQRTDILWPIESRDLLSEHLKDVVAERAAPVSSMSMKVRIAADKTSLSLDSQALSHLPRTLPNATPTMATSTVHDSGIHCQRAGTNL